MIQFLPLLKALDVKTWIIIGLGSVIIGLWVASQFQSHRINSLKNEVASKDVLIGQYKNNVISLNDAIKKQNASIVDMTKKNKDFESALNMTSAQNKKLNQNALSLIKMINTSPTPTDCKGAFEHLEQFTKQFSQDWNK